MRAAKVEGEVKEGKEVNEVDEAIKALKTNPGVESLIVVKNDGIVIKHENMAYRQAVQHAALVLDLCDKSKKFVGTLLDPPDNQVESIRLRAQDTETGHQHEMIVAQTPQYTLIVLQSADDGKEPKDDEDEDA